MKTALDLPDELVREIKIEAAKRGAKLKDLIAELLRVGLDARDGRTYTEARLRVDPRSGLKVVADTREAHPDNPMSPGQIAEMLQRHEAEWAIETTR